MSDLETQNMHKSKQDESEQGSSARELTFDVPPLDITSTMFFKVSYLFALAGFVAVASALADNPGLCPLFVDVFVVSTY